MKIKKFLCVTLTLAILIGIGSFSTQASGILSISYSVDGGTNFISLNGFDVGTTEYQVDLADNIPYVILSATSDDGTITYKVVDDYNATKYSHGGFRYQPFNSSSQTQYTLEREADNGMIPIKNEIATGKVIYTDADSNVSTYNITFKSKQPRVTAFTQSSDFTDGCVTFIGGGAVANDNGTILDSTASAERMYALANVSSTLVGSSMFVLPWANMSYETSTAVTEKDCEFFSFVADTDCTVTVLLAQPADSASEYTSWTCVNNGTQADNITTFTSPRNKNDYSNTDYFAMAYKWICGDTESNAYRVSSPGINGGELINNTHVKGGTKLTYAYSKSFTAGEKIRIYNPGCITTSETTALMPVMVKWENTHAIIEPSGLEISYSADNETYTSYNVSSYPSTGNPNLTLPDNTFYVYVNVNIPEGASVELVTSVYPYKNLLGANTSSITYNTGSVNAYKMRQEIAPNSPVPIKSEIIAVRANYTSPQGVYKEYLFEFSAKQPRITGFARHMSAPYNKVFFESGAAVDNNNRSVLDSNASSGSNRTWALANVSKTLEGASLLVLPWETALRDANSTTTYPNFATLKTDTPCTVYVLLDRPADPLSVYSTDWTCVNNGTIPERLNSTGRYNIPRNVNNFSETDYFAMAYKWVSKTSTSLYYENGVNNNNIYRVSNPGITGSISGGTHTLNFATFSYVYAKELAAGTDLQIKNPGSMDTTETSSLMPVMVKWHLPEPTVTVTDLSASSTSNTTTITATNTVVKSSPNQTCDYEAIAAVYSDSTCNELIDVAVGRFTEGETTLTFNNAGYGADAYVQFFVWKLGDLKPYTEKTVGLLSDISN